MPNNHALYKIAFRHASLQFLTIKRVVVFIIVANQLHVHIKFKLGITVKSIMQNALPRTTSCDIQFKQIFIQKNCIHVYWQFTNMLYFQCFKHFSIIRIDQTLYFKTYSFLMLAFIDFAKKAFKNFEHATKLLYKF